MFRKVYFQSKFFVFFTSLISFNHQVQSQINEGFDNIISLPATGWVMQNNSFPIGTIGWFQGNPTAFPAYSGATDSYIGSNFNNVNLVGTISNWLLTPNVTLKNGDVFTFYTRTSSDNQWADRLQVRMSLSGASANVGTTETSVGDFTQLLLEINPNLQLSVYPMLWTQYTITISGLSAPTSGRLAFRYFVTNGGINGTNSDYIGIDNFVYSPYVCPTVSITPTSLNQAYAGIPFNQSLAQTGGSGNVTYSISSGSLPSGLTLQTNGTISGTPNSVNQYNFTVAVTDVNGCIGTQVFSIDVLCNPNGASLNNLPLLCSNGSVVTLNQGLPTGGTYSGTGVTGNQFNPVSGTQLIIYSVNDSYGCLQTASNTISVNTAPTVTLGQFDNLCFNGPPIVLNGGIPAGGTYSGVGVNSGIFSPIAVGDFSITYSYTDGNNCTSSATQIIRVEVCAGLETAESATLRVTPNPSSGIFNLEGIDQNSRTLYVSNAAGQIVTNLDLKGQLHTSDAPFFINLNQLNDGIYFIHIQGSQTTQVTRIVVQR